MFIYQTEIQKSNNVIGLNVAQNTTDINDFQNNHKSQATEISEVIIAETTLNTYCSYEVFSSKISGVDILWSDVKYTSNSQNYTLYLLSQNSL